MNKVLEKRKKLQEIHGAMALYLKTDLPPKVRASIQNLQDRLDYRTQEYEKQLLDEKIDIYGQALEVLRKCNEKSLQNKN